MNPNSTDKEEPEFSDFVQWFREQKLDPAKREKSPDGESNEATPHTPNQPIESTKSPKPVRTKPSKTLKEEREGKSNSSGEAVVTPGKTSRSNIDKKRKSSDSKRGGSVDSDSRSDSHRKSEDRKDSKSRLVVHESPRTESPERETKQVKMDLNDACHHKKFSHSTPVSPTEDTSPKRRSVQRTPARSFTFDEIGLAEGRLTNPKIRLALSPENKDPMLTTRKFRASIYDFNFGSEAAAAAAEEDQRIGPEGPRSRTRSTSDTKAPSLRDSVGAPLKVIYGKDELSDVIQWIGFGAIIKFLLDTDKELDTKMLSVLLYTYSYFTDGHQLLQRLGTAFTFNQSDKKANFIQRIYEILNTWLQPSYCWQIVEDKALYRNFEKFISSKILHENQELAEELAENLIKAKTSVPMRLVHSKSEPRQKTKEIKQKLDLTKVATAASSSQSPTSSGSGSGVDSGRRTQRSIGSTTPSADVISHKSNIFTIHFPDNNKKSFILTPTSMNTTLSAVLPNLCLQRNMNMDDYLAEDLNGVPIELSTPLGQIPAGEINFLRLKEVQEVQPKILVLRLPEVFLMKPIEIKIDTHNENLLFSHVFGKLCSEHHLSYPEEVRLENEFGVEQKFDPSLTMGQLTEFQLFVVVISNRRRSIVGRPFKTVQKKKFDISGTPSEVLSVGFHIIEYKLFCNLTPRELFRAAWKKERKATLAPNVCEMVNWFNKTTHWFQTQVVSQNSPKERAHIIEKCISVANICLKQYNFNTLLEILSALNGQPVRRLKLSWKEVDKESMSLFESLTELFSPETNFASLRTLMAPIIGYEATPSPLPYIGVLLQDMMQLEETPDKDDGGLINWNKMTQMANNFHYIRSIQGKRGEFTMKPMVQNLLEYFESENFVVLSEKDLMNVSKIIEPPKVKPSAQVTV